MRLRSLLLPTLASLALGTTALAEDAKKKDAPYTFTVKTPDSAKVGKSATAEVHLTPSGGMHVNTEYPTSLAVTAPADVTVASAKVKPAKIDRSEARFDIALTPSAAGAKDIACTVNFVVCKDDNSECVPRKEQVKFTVNVK